MRGEMHNCSRKLWNGHPYKSLVLKLKIASNENILKHPKKSNLVENCETCWDRKTILGRSNSHNLLVLMKSSEILQNLISVFLILLFKSYTFSFQRSDASILFCDKNKTKLPKKLRHKYKVPTMSESAYNSPLLTRRLTDSCCSSPARSIRSHHAEDLTDSDGEGDQQCITEVPGTPDQTIISGWLKFRDNRKVS